MLMTTLRRNLRSAGAFFLSLGAAFPLLADEPDGFPPATPESQGISSKALERLSELIQHWSDAGVIVGAELLVIKNRRTVLHEVYGWRDREDQLPMVRDTIFNIGSMTKPVTGAVLQILIDEGKVRADAPVAKYLPGFDNEKSRKITVEQVLSHRSGLPATILNSMTNYPDLVAMGNAAGERGPEFKPGSKFWYSDSATDEPDGAAGTGPSGAHQRSESGSLLKPAPTMPQARGRSDARRLESIAYGTALWNPSSSGHTDKDVSVSA